MNGLHGENQERKMFKKIYLAGSIAGGRKYASELKMIAKILENLGHVILTKDNVVELKSGDDKANRTGRKEIMKRDKMMLRKSDLFIAEVSQASHGVGYEHRYAEELEKPILLLKQKLLKGKGNTVFLDGSDYEKYAFKFYDNKNIDKIIKEFITAFKKTTGEARG